MMHSPPFHPHPHTVGACASSPAVEEVQGLVIGPTIEEGEAALLAELRHMWSSSGGSVVIDIPVRAARAACACGAAPRGLMALRASHLPHPFSTSSPFSLTSD